ncbi:zinc-finger homeodomain protein 6-like [Chenopodium quinoa]|uniref:zinc-finger homeodomain protein 6-like n=1 Tax=Chenopodium quinoa TaxID=63459 RepID=UPI000B7700F0|nr:zinc-finger homeodomain protein 6-like [Chenopodium quinoa]
MEVKKPNKEIPFHSNSFIHNNLKKPPNPTLDLSHLDKYKDPSPSPDSNSPKAEMIRYRECQRNHAAHLGSHVVDGCGEFMPSGEEGSLLALKCAACDCHRNFHRQEVEGETTTAATATATAATILPVAPAVPPSAMTTTNCYISFSKYHKNNNNLLSVRPNSDTTTSPAVYYQQGKHFSHPQAPVMMAFGGGGVAAESSSDDLNAGNFDYRGQFVEQYGVSKKRFRTKFSQEQKDKMMEFAEKIGWKMQKQDDVQVQRFCHEVGVKRQVFKVWMHNNKQAMKKKQA